MTDADPLFLGRAVRLACELCGSRPSELIAGRVQFKHYVHARWAIIRALRGRNPKLSQPQLARAVGFRDHNSAAYALRESAYLHARSQDFRDLCARIAAA